MNLSLPVEDLVRILAHQLAFFDDRGFPTPLARVVDEALQRFEFAAARILAPGYLRDGEPVFNHLHADQSAAFLWFASNAAFRTFEDKALANQLFLLNKSRNGIVVMYDTELPRVFCLIHTVGTVLGKATYGEYFTAFHGVTVGTDRGRAPTLGKRCSLLPGARVIGDSTLADDVTLGPGALVAHTTIAAELVVRGSTPDHKCIPRRRDYAALVYRRLPGDEALLG